VAEIKDNEWSHQPRPAIFDRNYTSNILEIRDAMTGRVSLQLVDLGEAVYIAGLFLCTHFRIDLHGWTTGRNADHRSAPPWSTHLACHSAHLRISKHDASRSMFIEECGIFYQARISAPPPINAYPSL
jgi:hypothetical protein